jgi:hypothetical protein
MNTVFTLPAWLQFAVAAASIVSSVGVLIAFWQIFITKGQYQEQLKNSKDQFRLQNQGYILFDTVLSLYSPNTIPGTPFADNALLKTFTLFATMENSGNFPVILYLKHCDFYYGDKIVFSLDKDAFGKVIINPKQKNTNGIIVHQLDEQQGISFDQLESLNISAKLLMEYHDFNDTANKKTIEREMIFPIAGNNITTIYKHIYDKVPS